MPPRPPLHPTILLRPPLRPTPLLSNPPPSRPYSDSNSPFSKYTAPSTTPKPPTLSASQTNRSSPVSAIFDTTDIFKSSSRRSAQNPSAPYGQNQPHAQRQRIDTLSSSQRAGGVYGTSGAAGTGFADRYMPGRGGGGRGEEPLPNAPSVPGINRRFAEEKNMTIVPSSTGTIFLVDEAGEAKGEQLLRAVVGKLNLRTHVLQKVGERTVPNPRLPPEGTEGREEIVEMLLAEGQQLERTVPICRIYSFEAIKEQQVRQYQEMRAEKAAKKGKKKTENKKKEFKMSWGINPHDLQYRFKQIGDYLDDGARVEIILVLKRGMAYVEKAQQMELLKRIKEFMDEREARLESEDGVLGRLYMMTFQGRRLTEEQKIAAQRRREEKKLAELEAAREAAAMEKLRQEQEAMGYSPAVFDTVHAGFEQVDTGTGGVEGGMELPVGNGPVLEAGRSNEV